MAELRLIPLDEMLNKTQLKNLKRQLMEFGVDDLPYGSDDDVDLEETLNDDPLTDFMDRLEAHDLACDMYLPVEFDGTLELGEKSIGSAYALLDALEELREELAIDEEPSDDEEEVEVDLEVIEEQLRFTWRIFLRAASTCVDRQVPLHVIS